MASERYDKAVKFIVNDLSKIGAEVIEKAAARRDTRRITGNQLDAYGWAVYHNGKLMEQGFLTPVPEADAPREHNGKDYWGRETVENYFKTGALSVVEKKGFDLLCVNAVYYTDLLEGGVVKGNIYRIITEFAWESFDMISKYDDIYAGHISYNLLV